MSFAFVKTSFLGLALRFTVGHYFGFKVLLRSTVKKDDKTLNAINCHDTKTI